MWILLWVVLSVFVLFIFFWSTAILQQQKKAWSAFAQKLNLTYTPGKFNESPVVSGTINNRKITFFTDSRQTNDARGKRFMTALEIEFGPGMPTAAAIANQEYGDFLSPLKMNETYKPPLEGWGADIIVKTKSQNDLAAYLTPERQKILLGLFLMKNSATLFFFDEQDAVLRIETSDPLADAGRMEKITRKIFAAADVMALNAQEKRAAPAQPQAPQEIAPEAGQAPDQTTEK